MKIKWTRAHVGTTGNERADQLAKLATESPFIGPEPTIPVSISFCKKQVWNWAWNMFTRRWGGMSTCRQTKELFQKPLDRKGTSKRLQLTRHKMRLVLQELTCHGKLGIHLKLMGQWNNDTCKKCHLGVESREYIVEICPAYHGVRQDVLLSNIGSLQHLVTTQKLNRLARFLHESGRLSEV